MGKNSGISWTRHSFAPWLGCTHVSPACARCYADRLDQERGMTSEGFGQGKPRKRTSADYWKQPLKWNREAARTGVNPLVFASHLSDIFDNEVPPEWRAHFWQLVRETEYLNWLLLTKRITNALKMLPPDWPLDSCGLMVTVCNQTEWDRDVPRLLKVPAAWHGVSIEPMLGAVDITRAGGERLDWIITGGESGEGFRPMDIQWVRDVRDACARFGVPLYHKQFAGRFPAKDPPPLDGVIHDARPAILKISRRLQPTLFEGLVDAGRDFTL